MSSETGAVAAGPAWRSGREERHAAIGMLDEAVRVARDAGILSALSIGLFVLSSLVLIEDSDRPLALIDEAIDVGTQIGDHITVSSCTAAKGFVALRRGEWRTALRAAVDSAEQILNIGNVVNVAMPFDLASVAFGALGHVEPAAVVFGKTDAMFPDRRPPEWADQMLASARTAILDALGEQQAAMLVARGAALEFRDVVEYLRVQADLVLDD